ncbi:MAG: nucleoid-associated protein [Gallionella sp.]|nr:nucleoid-associated protein [Gallionella sp.]
MPNNIENLIVHKLVKDQHGAATIELADAAINITPSAQRLIDHLHKQYADRPGKGYGKFEEDEDNFPMPRYVSEYFIDHSTDYYSFSQDLMRHLMHRAGKEQLATGGYVLIAHVNNGVSDFLLVAIVTEVVGTAITEGLEIVDSVHLDMSNLRVAGRVDLTAWQAGAERYVSFLKGRGEVANYFKQFLGCNDVLVALQETQKLVRGLESFATEQHLESVARDQLFEQAFNYLDELGRNGNPVSLDAFANRVWPDSPDDLRAVLAFDELQLSDGFVPDRRAIKGLVKFKGASAHWKLEFDRRGLRNGDVRYDQDSNKLVLSNIPEALRKELLEELNDEHDQV